MVMVRPKPVEMMVVEILVEHVLLDKSAAKEPVSAVQTVLEDNVEMMVAEESHVDLVLHPKPAKTDSVQELLWLIVPEDNVETTELVETAETALLVKDAEPASVSATMTAMKEIAETPFKLMEPILASALKDLVEPVLPDSLVVPMDVVLLKHLVMF